MLESSPPIDHAKVRSLANEKELSMDHKARPTLAAEDALDEVERYELREAPAYVFAIERRTFVQTVGAGVLAMSNGVCRALSKLTTPL